MSQNIQRQVAQLGGWKALLRPAPVDERARHDAKNLYYVLSPKVIEFLAEIESPTVSSRRTDNHRTTLKMLINQFTQFKLDMLGKAKQSLAQLFDGVSTQTEAVCKLIPRPSFKHLEPNCFDKISGYLGTLYW